MIPRDTYASIPAGGVDRRRCRSIAGGSSAPTGWSLGTVRKTGDRRHGPGAAVQRRAARQRCSRKEYTGPGGQPAALRAHDLRRDPQAAARAARRGADQAHLLVRSRRRADAGTVENARRQGDLHRRLRRRQPAPHHRQPLAEHQPECGRRTAGRSPTPRTAAAIPTSTSRTSTRARWRRRPTARRPELPAGVLARRHAHRVHVEPRRQPGDLRDEPRRLEPAPAHQHPGDRLDADVVAGRQPDRVHLRSVRLAADLRRSTPTAWACRGGSRTESCADRATWSPAPYNEIAYAAPHRPRLRHQDLRARHRRRRGRSPWRRQQREPGVVAQRPAPRVRVHARRATQQIFTIARDGKDLRQVTKDGNNLHADLVALAACAEHR